MRSPAAHARFWSVAALGLTVDLASKEWAFRTLGQGGHRVVIPHVLELQTMMNDGALFGIGSGQTTLFLVASALALALVSWMFVQSSARSWLLHVALGAILAGAVGNMHDRLFVRLVALPGPGGLPLYFEKRVDQAAGRIELREYPVAAEALPDRRLPLEADAKLPEIGHVRDFIKIPTKLYGERDLWPWVFNVADVLLVAGVGILAVRLWREHGEEQPAPARGAAASGSPGGPTGNSSSGGETPPASAAASRSEPGSRTESPTRGALEADDDQPTSGR